MDIDERAKQILEFLKENLNITRWKMAEMLGHSESTVKRKLGELTDNNVIRRIGANKKDEWIIMK